MISSKAALAIVVISLTFPWSATAQPENITGVVRDATGIGIAAATVTVTNRTTKESKTATTGPDGRYSVPVAAGSYTVAAAFPSFRGAVQTVDVSTGEPKQVDFTLETTSRRCSTYPSLSRPCPKRRSASVASTISRA